MHWQPISTAPMDGTDILVYFQSATVDFIHIAYYDSDEHDSWKEEKFESKEQKIGWWYFRYSCSQYKLEGFEQPTHWCPLELPKDRTYV